MIRYPFDAATALAEIARIDPRWKSKADRRTAAFVKAKAYSEKSSLWSTVKPVYMALQANKCVFCERQFENERYGKIEFDVEHFRPKSSVKAWPDAKAHPTLRYEHQTGAPSNSGYYWLAYDVENYAASCKACNSALKSNYFPVGGDRGAESADFRTLLGERPFLCYPLGQLDADPEDLVSYVGTIAKPRASTGYARERGQIIIDFFDLNGRDVLHYQRAQMIAMVGGALAARAAGTASPLDDLVIAKIGNPAVPHASCLRSFKRLFDQDPQAGCRVWEKCRLYAMEQTASAPPEL